MEHLEQFLYVIKYKKGKTNMVANNLFKRNKILSKLEAQILSFDHLSELYEQDFFFPSIFASCQTKA